MLVHDCRVPMPPKLSRPHICCVAAPPGDCMGVPSHPYLILTLPDGSVVSALQVTTQHAHLHRCYVGSQHVAGRVGISMSAMHQHHRVSTGLPVDEPVVFQRQYMECVCLRDYRIPAPPREGMDIRVHLRSESHRRRVAAHSRLHACHVPGLPCGGTGIPVLTCCVRPSTATAQCGHVS